MIILKKGYTLHAIAGTGGVVNCTVSTDTTILFRNQLDESLIQICKADISDVIIDEIQLLNTSGSTVDGIYFYIQRYNTSFQVLGEITLLPGALFVINDNRVSDGVYGDVTVSNNGTTWTVTTPGVDIGTEVSTAPNATPNDTDFIATVEGTTLKKITWTDAKAFLETYFDTLYLTAASLTDYFDKTVDDTDDITESATKKFITVGEQNKLGFISITQPVDLDVIESDTVLNNAKVTNATHTGDATGSTALTVVGINNIILSSLGTGILKNTTGTGIPSIAVAADFPTLNQSTTGNAATATLLQTARNIQGVAFDGSTNIDIINGTGFVKAVGTTLSYDNSTYLTTSGASGLYQPLDSDLTTIAGLTATTDNFIVSVGSAWASRTPTQVKATLAIANTDVSGLGTLSTQNGTFSGTHSGNSSGTNTGDQTTVTGNAGTATALQTARTIGIATGDITSIGSTFNGTANNTNSYTLATVNGNVGTFGSATQTVTVAANAKGLITAISHQTVTPAISNVTGMAAGVSTALATNIGTVSSFVQNGGALGTPSSGVATNLTGTASGLTAGTVTTNANLTGPITSSGNATSIASQTGTGTKFVVDNTPTLITPILGVATATSINTGTTLNGVGFFKSTVDIDLTSTTHALTVGGESNSTNLAIGEYSTGTGLQSRNNSTIAALDINPLGGDVRFGLNAPAGVYNIIGRHTGTGTGDFIELSLRNGVASTAEALLIRTLGTNFTTSSMNFQDGCVVAAGTNLSGGLSIGTQGSFDLRLYTANTLRTTWNGATGNILTTGKFTSSGGGIGYSTGAGVAITQGTSRTTTVSSNKLCGTIAMFSSAKATQTSDTFTFTNSLIEIGDNLVVMHNSSTDGGCWNISTACAAGSATITVRNVSNASITSATPLKFSLIKGVTT